jgi:hypothetical protein
MRLFSRLAAAMAVLVITLATAISASGSDGALIATLNGKPIEADLVSKYHCRDAGARQIRCFMTAEARDDDADATQGVESLTVTYYVTWYEHINYGGASFSASSDWTNLGIIGWNNTISSFKSLNGGRPKWYDQTNYGLPSSQWAAGAWVSYVGDARNDTFSSVKNLP